MRLVNKGNVVTARRMGLVLSTFLEWRSRRDSLISIQVEQPAFFIET